MTLRRMIARWLAPEVFAEHDRYGRLVRALRDVSSTCGYEFPTVRLVVDWIMGTTVARAPLTVTSKQLLFWLRAQEGAQEDPEVALRLHRALEDVDERRAPARS